MRLANVSAELISASPSATRARVRRLLGLVGIAALAFACDPDSYRSPTAPSPQVPPSGATGVLNGTMTIVGASPAGDCVADRFAGDAKAASQVSFTIPSVEGSWTGGYFLELFQLSCSPLKLASSQGGYLELELYPYCDIPYSAVDSVESCDPELDGSLVPSRVRMPAPAADGTVRGDGAVVIDRWDPRPIAPVELAVHFDLHP